MALAAALAATELLLGLNSFFVRGRLDPAPFLPVRLGLLIAAALLAGRFGWRVRAALYALFILLAAAAETALQAVLGAGASGAGALCGIGLAVAAAVPVDLAVHAGRRWRGRPGAASAAALAALAMVLLALGAARFGRSDAAGPGAGAGPPLLVMTSLPLIWGEGGAFDPASRPAEAYRLLQQEFAVRPIDTLDAASLGGGRLLLLAHPRWLEPAELVALDGWVRGGGRALILTDPALVWPTELAPGDVRRPPPTSLLGPLLAHWGLALDPPESRDLHDAPGPATVFRGPRKLAMEAAGRFRATGGSCRVGPQPWLAACTIGKGAATLIADADLLRDDLWLPPGSGPGARTADNPLLLADLLDSHAGPERPRRHKPVSWIAPGAPRAGAVAAALVPLALLAGFALLLRRKL